MNTLELTDAELKALARLVNGGFMDLERWGENPTPEMVSILRRVEAMEEALPEIVKR